MPTLPVSNLKLSEILANCLTLPTNPTVKDIFYHYTGRLKTTAEFTNTVGGDGKLNPIYCPGATETERRYNALMDRKLSYFKGMTVNT